MLMLALVLLGDADAGKKLKFSHVYETSEIYHTWALWAAEEIENGLKDAMRLTCFLPLLCERKPISIRGWFLVLSTSF
jgi:hypothetical protein